MDPKPKNRSELTDEERQVVVTLRKEKLDQTQLKLENGLTQQVASGRWTEYLKFLSHIPRHNFNNLILIIFQFPQAMI